MTIVHAFILEIISRLIRFTQLLSTSHVVQPIDGPRDLVQPLQEQRSCAAVEIG
jgi:hypothetical protein